MEKEFFLRYKILTNASITTKEEFKSEGKLPAWSFRFKRGEDNIKLFLFDFEKGIRVQAVSQAQSIKDARKKVKPIIEYICYLISFTTNEVVESGVFEFGYDYTSGIEERVFAQQFILSMYEDKTFNDIKEEAFREVFSASLKKGVQDEIMRGMMFFRYSLKDELSVLVRFSLLWQALEALDELLLDYYKISEEERNRTCDNCGHKLGPKSSLGIKQLFGNKDLFRKIRKFRGIYFHSSSSIDQEKREEAEKYNNSLREKFKKAICLLCDINDNFFSLSGERRPLDLRSRMVIYSKLLDSQPPSLNKIEEQPRLRIETQNITEIREGDIKNHIEFEAVKGNFGSEVEVEAFDYDNSREVIEDFEIAG